MFLRSSSTSFSQNNPKSNLFGINSGNSYQFGSHRSSCLTTAFSIWDRCTQGFSFHAGIQLDQWNRPTGSPRSLEEKAKLLLGNSGITAIQISFDGSGDSGDVTYDYCSSAKDYVDFSKLVNSRGLLDSNCYEHDTQTSIHVSAKSQLEDLCYQALESEYGGWEINSGSFGTVVWNENVFLVDVNDHFYECEICCEEYNDDQPCSCKTCDECYEKSALDETLCENCGKPLTCS